MLSAMNWNHALQSILQVSEGCLLERKVGASAAGHSFPRETVQKKVTHWDQQDR